MLTTRLTASGFGTGQAQSIVGDATLGLTATGSSQSTALQLLSPVNNFTSVAAGAGCLLPTNASPGDTVQIWNGGSAVLNIYPQPGSAIGNLATNVPIYLSPSALGFLQCIDKSGNWAMITQGLGQHVGVGVAASPGWQAGASTIELGSPGTGIISGTTAPGTVTVVSNLYLDGSAQWRYAANGFAGAMNIGSIASGNGQIYTSTSGTANNLVNFQFVMGWNSDGTVQIGAPATGKQALTLTGATGIDPVAFFINEAATRSITWNNGNASGGTQIYMSAGGGLNNSFFQSSPTYTGLGTYSAQPLFLYTNGSSRVAIASGGQILLGSSATQYSELNWYATQVTWEGPAASTVCFNVCDTTFNNSSGMVLRIRGLTSNGAVEAALQSVYMNASNVYVAGGFVIQGASGSLQIGSAITRAVISLGTLVASGKLSAAHGGPRIPDIIQIRARCTTASAGYSVNDEVDVDSLMTAAGTHAVSEWCNATTVGCSLNGAADFTTQGGSSNTGITVANWSVYAYCHWL